VDKQTTSAQAKSGRATDAAATKDKLADKPSREKSKDSRDAAGVEAKPKDAKADGKPGTSAPKNKPKPEKITWTEQRTWRDGSPAPLQGANTVYFLTRKVVSTRPRTVMVQVDGPAGFKMWVNGEKVQTSAPPHPSAAPPKPGTAAENKIEESADPEGFDIDTMMGRARSKTEKKFRIGLRQGKNEIVLKIVLAVGGPGGNAFTFHLTPEGDDVVTHEVATALRLEARERSQITAQAPTAGAGPSPAPASKVPVEGKKELPSAPTGVPAGKVRLYAREPDVSLALAPPGSNRNGGGKHSSPIKQEETKKASLVGEKSAPLKSYEEENKLSPSQRRHKVLREYFCTHIDSVGRVLSDELAKLKDEERELKRAIPETLVMEEWEKPRQAYVFIRGLYKNRGQNVSPTTPAVLPHLAKELPRNRLGLAKWLVSGRHPLTTRVLVNRVWQQYFGLGIVRTAEDFGIRGEPPVHPELLDYLATELVDSKWDLKKLHKRIVLSATYRQASQASKEKLERDPENRLLARGPRLRLSAEMVRDNALAVSGLLFEKIGGESVKPVQPDDAWKTVEGNIANAYRRDRGEKQYRRSLYVYWKRGSPYPSMLNFDAVKRDACTVTRATTTTPLQALTLLNDPAYVEFAKMLGQRMLKDREALGRARDLKKPEEDARRLAYGFRLCTSRWPTEPETRILQKLLDEQRSHFKADVAAAKKLLGVGDAKVEETLDPAEAAAWASVGNALLNLDATIHR
jgi:hypothetical protein